MQVVPFPQENQPQAETQEINSSKSTISSHEISSAAPSSASTSINGTTRRGFIGTLGLAAAATYAATVLEPTPLKADTTADQTRIDECYKLRKNAAYLDWKVGAPIHPVNGDEQLYSNYLANYSKGLQHDNYGIVTPSSYLSLLNAVNNGNPSDFQNIQMGGNTPLVNPQSGLAFDMEGLDSHQFLQGPPPAFASAQRAAEAVELYWMALLRDTNFTQYASDSLAQQACAELSSLSGLNVSKVNGQVTPATLFRGLTPGDLYGPYVSQFLMQPIEYGAIAIDQTFRTYLPLNNGGTDYLTDAASWLAVQNGIAPSDRNRLDSTTRHLRNGRDLSAYVHVDVLFEAYMNACLWLIDNGAPFSPTNPYNNSTTETGFGTFGSPHIKALLAEVSQRALKAVWYQKWFVHRTIRPEEFGGRVHFTETGAQQYPIHPQALNSQAVAQVFSRNGSYFLPHAFPEGCPQHPSYGSGHATVAGACTTVLKAFFNETWVIPNPMVPSEDGLQLLPYTGSDAGQITVGGELNKVANNIGLARLHAGIHWRSDNSDSLTLGEAVAISVMKDQRQCYNEYFKGFTFTKFDGTKITI